MTPSIIDGRTTGSATVEATTNLALVVVNDGVGASKAVSASVKIYRSDSPGTVVASADSSTGGGPVPAAGNLTLTVAIPSTKGLAAWGPSTPVLYTAEVTLKAGGETLQTATEEFGYRSFSFDAKTGFTINGEQMKLYGGCVHHDNGPLGSKAIGKPPSQSAVAC